MHFTNIQKAKVVLIINFIVLCLIIVTTPYFIKQGLSFVSEQFAEGFFLAVELAALFIVFKHYDAQMKKKEEEAKTLNFKLEKKERELLNALEYLGKVNVQVSMIKSLLETTKIPSTKNQLLEVFSELLRIVCSMTKKDSARLRIVNLENLRTLSEHVESIQNEGETCTIDAGNRRLAEMFKKKEKKDVGDCCVFYSNTENFSLKAFIFVPNGDNKEHTREERVFLETIANQCEIIFILFNSGYFKTK